MPRSVVLTRPGLRCAPGSAIIWPSLRPPAGGWGWDDAEQCPGGPRGRCPGATQLDTQLYGYSLMKSRNLCMEWLRTVPSCGAACSYGEPVQRSVRVCRTLGAVRGPSRC